MLRRILAVFTLTAAALTTPAAAQADTTYRGEGDDVVRIHATKKPGLIRFTHDGESNFIVHTVDSRGRTGEYLINCAGHAASAPGRRRRLRNTLRKDRPALPARLRAPRP
ncbi:hypothetical protein ACQPZZ_17635 [Microbispora sp. CA-135349]|uniref:hypothetical protein n=1 Tax=Microbispora sp. CA-135349 TaxID=3239953 RepID=UPI003D9141C1